MADLTERIDDAILISAFRVSRLRELPIRAGLKDVRASFVENAELEADPIWGLRVDRCNAMLYREDAELRDMARAALERER